MELLGYFARAMVCAGCGNVCGAAEKSEDLCAGHAILRVACHQPHADGVQIVGNIGGKVSRRGGFMLSLVCENARRHAFKGPPAGQRLVEHHAHGIPVRGLRDPFTAH